MKSAGKARSYGLYRHIRKPKEIIGNLLNDYDKSIDIQRPLRYIVADISQIEKVRSFP